jgi:hypothetical protein
MIDNTITGSVCIDCLLVIANGDTSGIEDLAAWESAVLQANSTEDGRYTIVPVADETHFSTSMCDNCRTTLAGDRHDVVFIDNQK